MKARSVVVACLLAANTALAAGLSPDDPRLAQPVQPGMIQKQPGTGMAPVMKEMTIWVFADIKLTVLGPTTVKVDWKSRPDATSYRVIRDGVAIGDVPQHAPPLTFVDDGLTPGSAGTYKVQALQVPPPVTSTATGMKGIRGDIGGAKLALTEVVLEESRTTSATTPPLTPPGDLAAVTTSFTAVRLTWTVPRWATPNYNLYRDGQFLRQGTGNATDDGGLSTATHVYAVQSIFAKADGTPLPGPVSQQVSINVGPKLCMPGTKRQCDYMGSAGQSHCLLGEQVCTATGDAFGQCEDTQFRCGNWDPASFKECASMGRAKYVSMLRDIPSGDNPETYVRRHPAIVNGATVGAMAYSRDLLGHHWGSFDVSHSQCFVYNFNFWQTCTSPVSGSKLYQDPNTGRTYRENFGGVCLSECFGSNERKVYNTEPAWGSEPFLQGGAGPQRCETIITKSFDWSP